VLLTIAAVTGVNAPNVFIYQSPIDYLRAICEAVLLLNAARMLVIEIYQAFKYAYFLYIEHRVSNIGFLL
jgi:hypothetical protein